MKTNETTIELPGDSSEHMDAATYLTRDPDDIVTIASLFKALWVLLFALL